MISERDAAHLKSSFYHHQVRLAQLLVRVNEKTELASFLSKANNIFQIFSSQIFLSTATNIFQIFSCKIGNV